MARSHSSRPAQAKVRRSVAIAGTVVAVALLVPSVAAATTDSYIDVGKHTWLVPAGVTQLTVDVAAGDGGSDASGNGCVRAAGAVVQGTVQVTPGAQLTIDVGGRGGDAPVGGAGGVAGDGGDLDGGAGGSAGTSSPVGGGGGGGGSGIVAPTGPLVVAGGGGGCGGFATPAGFGNGGDHGAYGAGGSQGVALGGAPGTGTGAGNGGGSDPSTDPGGSPGIGDDGGAGASATALKFGGGGGGGGYYGGGGGGGAEPLHGVAGGGGGGSDYAPAGVTVSPQGSHSNGHVTITYTSAWTGAVVGKQFVPLVHHGPNRDGYTLLQTGRSNFGDFGNPWVVPSTGVITAWGFQTASTLPDSLELKVGRGDRVPSSGGYFTIIGSSPATNLIPSQLNTYAVRIPVQAGDMLGAYQTGATNIGFAMADNFPEYSTYADSNIGVGTTHWFEYDDFGEIVPVVARVEPDADSDGFGDLSQDACLGRYGTANGCPQADLAVTASANATSLNVGQDVIYTVTATNNGPDPVPVTVTDPLPAGTTFLTAVSNPGSCSAGPPVTCDFGTLASGKSGTATVIVEATQAGTLSNTATVPGPNVPDGIGAGDPNPGNNSATASTDVLAPAGSPGGGTPGAGTPGAGTPPGGGTPGAGTPGAGTPGAGGTPAFKGVTIKLSRGAINAKRGIARITLVATLAAKGQVKLTAVTGKGKKRKTITLGHAAFTIGAAKTKTVALHLTRSALKLLKKKGALKVLAVATASNQTGISKTNRKRATLKLR